VTPNNAHDMHDGSIAQGDAWLEQNLSDYAEWAEDNNSLLMVTFDEGQDDGENHIPLIVYGAGVVPGEYDQPGDRYDLLRTIESYYGLAPLGHAAQGEVLEFDRDGTTTPPTRPPPTTTPSPTAILGTDEADELMGTSGQDEIRGLAGNDLLVGYGGEDLLLGGSGDDRLRSGTGSDTINGGEGQDQLFGGDDDNRSDTFVFDAWGESTAGGERDVIHHFVSGEDQIDLRNIDVSSWAGQNAADNAVWWKGTANGVLLCADVNGDAQADFEVLLKGTTIITSADVMM